MTSATLSATESTTQCDTDVRIRAHTLTSAAGVGNAANLRALKTKESGLIRNNFADSHLDTWIGRVADVEEHEAHLINGAWASRNNALASLSLAQDGFRAWVEDSIAEFGRTRLGVVVGTSTSSIGRTEEAYRQLCDDRMPAEFHQPLVHNPHSPAAFVADTLAIDGPQITISTACSSSAKVFATASRWLRAGVVDACVVGGVDSLCLSVLHGFHALELVSNNPCKPFDVTRDGINIGEAAGFALLTRAENESAGAIRLSGVGESSDAWHMSHPHPEGLGAELAIRAALSHARLDPEDIDYINLHGTASRANDAIEAKVIQRLFNPAQTCVSSTKGWTGHTLGAAGIVELLFAVTTLLHELAPGTMGLETTDPDVAFPILAQNETRAIRHVMSNSFGFGGNNCAVICSKCD